LAKKKSSEIFEMKVEYMKNFKILLNVVVVSLLLNTPFSCQNAQQKPGTQNTKLEFTTWDNICYDRAASVWLIKKYVDPTAKFDFVEFGKKIEAGVPFDVPGAVLGRQRNFSCFETIIQKYSIDDPVIRKLAKIVHDIDVNIWGNKVFAFSDSLDLQFKSQRKEISDNYLLLDKFANDIDALYLLIQNDKIHVK
jgi:hypothetical protein